MADTAEIFRAVEAGEVELIKEYIKSGGNCSLANEEGDMVRQKAVLLSTGKHLPSACFLSS
jgi:hypothetical protein